MLKLLLISVGFVAVIALVDRLFLNNAIGWKRYILFFFIYLFFTYLQTATAFEKADLEAVEILELQGAEPEEIIQYIESHDYEGLIPLHDLESFKIPQKNEKKSF